MFWKSSVDDEIGIEQLYYVVRDDCKNLFNMKRRQHKN